jgi:phosphoribosylglycinamide formyltransferase 1
VKRRLGVLVSGGGSNLQALIDAAAHEAFPAQIVTVISNAPGVKALDRAEAAGIPAQVIDHRPYSKDRAGFDAALDAALRAVDVELVVLAGFMRVLTEGFVRAWEGRMLNIHPALLPSFKGLHTHARALETGVAIHGCTVHWVSPGVDEGAILGQAAVPVAPDDTAESLGARVLTMEHRLYPACVALAAAGRATLKDGRSLIDGAPGPLSLFWSPT